MCKENSIDMVFLPSNSTHLTQPLDVAFFRPLKTYWREILTQWKQGPGKIESSVPKDVFPRLLNKLITRILPTSESNLKSGFKKCGIVPLSSQVVLDRLPKNSTEVEENEDSDASTSMDQSLFEYLKELRGWNESKTKRRAKKRLQVEPGRSVSMESCESEVSEEVDNPGEVEQ